MIPYQIKNILVPVDLSQSALNAVDAAVALAKSAEADLHLLYIDEPLARLSSAFLTATGNGLVHPEDVLNALAATIRRAHFIEPAIVIEAGNVPETIMKVAALKQADLIVMGAHGASGIREGFVGNNTYNVLKYAAIPVLSVPNQKKAGLFKKIIYPFRPVAGEQMHYDYILPFTSYQTSIELLAVFQRLTDAGTRALHSFAEEVNGKFAQNNVSVKIAQGTAARIGKELVKYAQQTDPDLVVITGALDMSSNPFFVGPHTQTVINCVKSPVLSIKNLGLSSQTLQQAKSAGRALLQ